jgi:hypothetical protein
MKNGAARIFGSIALAALCTLASCFGIDDAPTRSAFVPGLGTFTVTPISGLVTTEAGTRAAFTVVLDIAPTADVVVNVASSNPAEGYASKDTLTFTPLDWDGPQTVIVTGEDDPLIDGDVAYSILLSPAVSADPQYSGVDPPDVTVTNQSDDVAGTTVIPDAGLATCENGTTATFTIVLNAEPSADVTIPIVSSDTALGTVAPSSVVFTPANWDVAQTVTVTGQDDLTPTLGPPAPYSIDTGPAVSTDPDFSGLVTPSVAVLNYDNDTAGITVTPTADLITSESGDSDLFVVVLNAAPTAPVRLNLASSNPLEWQIATVTSGPATSQSLDFDGTNWFTPQIVSVVGVDDPDPVIDGDATGAIQITVDPTSAPEYLAVVPVSPTVTNQDDDVAGFRVEPLVCVTTEGSTAVATFAVNLHTIPSSTVTIPVTSLDATEGAVSPASLTFLPDATALEPQTVTVTPVDDQVVDGDRVYSIQLGADAATADLHYQNLVPPSVTVTNQDDDVAGISVLFDELTTSETGTSTQIQVVLESIPTAPVTITFTGLDATEGALDQSVLVFPADGDALVPQIVTVTGVDDAVVDGPQLYTLTGTPISVDPIYGALPPFSVEVLNNDDDVPIQPPLVNLLPPVGGALVPGSQDEWDDESVDEPSVLDIAGTFNLWYEGFNHRGEKHEGVGYATSAIAPGPFAKDPSNPVLGHTGRLRIQGEIDRKGVGAPSVYFDGATYRMWFSCRADSIDKLEIAYAESQDGVRWVKHTSSPGGPTVAVLSPTKGTFDHLDVTSPHVLFDAGIYKMWYQGTDAAGLQQIGYATSPDGVVWTKHGVPVLHEGPLDAFDTRGVGQPCVILEGSTYIMCYAGTGIDFRKRLGLAVSADGISWSRYANNPVLDLGAQGSFDENGLSAPWILKVGSTFHVWFAGEDAHGNFSIGYTRTP